MHFISVIVLLLLAYVIYYFYNIQIVRHDELYSKARGLYT